MIVGILIGLIGIILGGLMYRHVVALENRMHEFNRGAGFIPTKVLDAMRPFNLFSLRAVALWWIAIGGLAIVLTTYKLVSE
jgi:hypothetical protein